MSEMLGNYYFMINRFKSACHELEKALKEEPKSLSIRKKLILCYLDSGSYTRGYQLFRSVIKQDISSITEAKADNTCPCLEILDNFERNDHLNLDKAEYYRVLAMLWLFRDINQSLRYFKIVKSLSNDDKNVDEILSIIAKKSVHS